MSWAFLAMAGVAALGLHLLDADAAGSLGPMTAAVVVLAVGGTVAPSGDVSALGLTGEAAGSAIDITPLGVSLVGALVLGWLFVRSLRRSGAYIGGGELAARAGALAALFVALLGGLAWAGHDSITIDGAALVPDDIGGGGGGGDGDGGIQLPGGFDLGDIGLGDVGGGLGDAIADLIGAKAAVGFRVDTGASLLGGALWVLGVLLIALLASRPAPLPRALAGAHRVVRPAASALTTVLLLAVAAGVAAALYAAIGDDHPRRVLGAALLGAPNGVWLGVPLGLFVPWHGSASGVLVHVLPDPLDRLLTGRGEGSITLGSLAELDSRVWLLSVAAALMMLLAGVFTAVRTPREGKGVLPYALRCGLRLGVVTALALPLLVWLTGLSANASLSVLGIDALDAGLELSGSAPMALLLGAAWGAGAGFLAALPACATGAAGRRAAPAPLAETALHEPPAVADRPGPYTPTPFHRPPNPDTNPYLRTLSPREQPAAPPATPPGAPPGDPSTAPTVGGLPLPLPPRKGPADPSSAPTVGGLPLPPPHPPASRPGQRRRWQEPPDEPPPPGRPKGRS